MSLMDSDDLERVLSESEENSSSDETTGVLDGSYSVSLQGRIRKHLYFFTVKVKKVKFSMIFSSVVP